MKSIAKIIILALGMFICNSTMAGWVISELSADKFGNKQFQTTFIQNNMIRYETESSVAIIDLKTGNIILLFSLYKMYWEGSIEEFKNETMDVFEKKLQNIIATAAPEQKEVAMELIRDMREDFDPGKIDSIVNLNMQIRDTKTTEVISGIKAVKYDILLNDTVVESIWITDSINPYKDIDIESMVSFTNQLKPFEDNNTIEGSDAYLNLIKTGLAVKSQEVNPIGGFYTTIVTSVIETNINNEIFMPAEGYRKAKLAEIMLMEENKNSTYKLKEEFMNAKENPLYD